MAKYFQLRKYVKAGLPLVLILTIFCSGALGAEQKVLTLDQLIEMAVATSPELKIADLEVVSAKADLKMAKAGMLPQMDLRGIVGPVDEAKEPIVVVDPVTMIGRIKDPPNFNSSAITVFGRLDFTIEQPLYTFGKISNRRDAAALGVEAQIAGKNKVRNEVVLQMKELYYAYLIAGQGKKAAGEADDFIKDAGSRIRRLIEMKATNADQSDLYRLDAFSAEVKAFEIKATTGSHLAYQSLKRFAGIPENEDFRIDKTELPREPRHLAPEEEYVQMALANRPEFTQVKKGVEARRKLMEAAKADFYPSFGLAVVGSVAGAPNRDNLDVAYFGDEFNHAYAGVVAGAEWHFDLGITKGKLDKAKAAYLKTAQQRDQAVRFIPLEVMKYYQDAREAEVGYQAYQQAAIGSRRWIVTAFSNFDVGTGTARDMFDAIDRYGKNQGEYLRALYNYHVALARLEYAVGQR